MPIDEEKWPTREEFYAFDDALNARFPGVGIFVELKPSGILTIRWAEGPTADEVSSSAKAVGHDLLAKVESVAYVRARLDEA